MELYRVFFFCFFFFADKKQKPKATTIVPTISLGNDCPECADVLKVFRNVDNLCQKLQIIDMWSPVRRILCTKRDNLLANAQCFSQITIDGNCNEQVFFFFF